MKALAFLVVAATLALPFSAVAQQTTQENQPQPAEAMPFKSMAEMSPEEKKAWEAQSIEKHRDAFFKRVEEQRVQQKKDSD